MASPSKHFDVFGMQPIFSIDQHALKKQYHELSKKFHPDVQGNSCTAQAHMDEINKAYSILKDDFSRAKHLSCIEPSPVSQEFLIEMLDYEDAISSITSNHQEQAIRNDLLQRIEQCKLNHSNAEHLSKWAYYERLIKILDESKITLQQ